MTGLSESSAQRVSAAERKGFIYQGTGEPHDGITSLPAPPPWRTFSDGTETEYVLSPSATEAPRGHHRAVTYQPAANAVQSVNAALLLRRPLLVTGPVGSGKSSLAYAVAHELKLGPVLRWPITRTTTLQDGLYVYDAISHLRDSSFQSSTSSKSLLPRAPSTASYLRLGPLGTALLPSRQPRVLLLDDLDESDIDLPNDLLNIFETGGFAIPELTQYAEAGPNKVITHDGTYVQITRLVRCSQFPLIIITSGGERDFPPRFLRQCLRLHLDPPSARHVAEIVAAHLGGVSEADEKLIDAFLNTRTHGDLSVDQLLNAIFMSTSLGSSPEAHRLALVDQILRILETDGRE